MQQESLSPSRSSFVSRVVRTLLARPSIIALVSVLTLALVASAGSLTPPGAPSPTMNTLAELYESIVGVFDSSAVVANQNGSLIENLKYIEANLPDGVTSDSLDFDEFVDAMTLDADTSITNNGFALTIDSAANTALRLTVDSDDQYILMLNNLTFGNTDGTGVGFWQGDTGTGNIDVNGLNVLSLETTGRVVANEFLGFATNPIDNRHALSGIANITGDASLGSQDISAVAGAISFQASSGTTDRTEAGSFVVVTSGAGGNINNAIGLNGGVQALGATTVDTAIGGLFGILSSGSTVMTNAYGINISSLQIDAAGTAENNYGLYINDQDNLATTLNYNIYSAGTGLNYFGGTIIANGGCVGCGVASSSLDFDEFSDSMNLDADTSIASHGFTLSLMGNLGVGTLTPTSTLDVTGNISAIFANPADLTPAVNGTANILDTALTGDHVWANQGTTRFLAPAGTTLEAVGGLFGTVGIGAAGSTITTAIGVSGYVQNLGDNNIGSAFAGRFGVTADGTGTITNAYGIEIDSNIVTTGTISNSYGLYIASQAAGALTNYNIYSQGPGFNYFEDNTGIGTAIVPNSFLNIQTPTIVDRYALTINNEGFGASATQSFAFYQDATGIGHINVQDSEAMTLYPDRIYSRHTNGYVNDPNSFDYAVGAAANILDATVAGQSITAANGQAVFDDQSGTGTTDTTVGGSFETISQGTGGLINHAYGASGYVSGGGSDTINRAIGTAGGIIASDSSTIIDAYALYGGLAQINDAGQITNNYGLYLEDQSGVGTTLNYNLFSAGGAANFFGGSVGIGAVNPAATLDVDGNVQVNLDGTQATFAVCHPDNGATVDQELVDCDPTVDADYMEMYPMESSARQGDIVMPDSTRWANTVDGDRVAVLVRATDSSKVLGIVSDKTGAGDFNSVGHNIKKSDNPLPLALNGRVKVKVNLQNGPIAVGDPIGLSATPGVGAKAVIAGYIIGTALEPATQAGTVMVYVRSTYWAPDVAVLNSGTASSSFSPTGDNWAWSTVMGHIQSFFASLWNITIDTGLVQTVKGVFGEVKTDKLCLDDVCVDKEQLRQILQSNGISSPGPTPTPDETPTPSPTPSENPELESGGGDSGDDSAGAPVDEDALGGDPVDDSGTDSDAGTTDNSDENTGGDTSEGVDQP